MGMKRFEGRTMVIHRLLFQLVVLGASLGSYPNRRAEVNGSTTKPGCRSSCGDLVILYPFGLSDSSSDCRNDHPSFTVGCDNSTVPPTAYMHNKTSNLRILNISLDDHEMRVVGWIGQDCYNSSGYDSSLSNNPSLELAKLPISSTKNKFTAVGCDTLASFQDSDTKFSSGCMSLCSSLSDVRSGFCSGIGCCQTSIPKDAFNYDISFWSFSNHSLVLDFNPCSFSFIAETGFYNFSVGDLSHFPYKNSTVVLDWAIGNQTCEEAKKNSASYMCTNNTKCTNAENRSGYKCMCLEGYQGNPYLTNGCYDIDECVDPKKDPCKGICKHVHDPCEGICHNVGGSYTCSCPKGYHGDGQGCIANLSHKMEILAGVGTVIGTIVSLLLCWWLYRYIKRRREAQVKRRFFKRNGGFLLQQRLSSIEDTHMERGKLFTSTELDRATDHFDENRILGRGDQGTVYKGMLTDGTIIAVKKSKVIDIKQVGQFVNEAVILSEINHRNVVKLFGFCLESEVPLLVYEFVPNGTLYQYLHDPAKEFQVSWEIRLRIANEVARALSYLHSDAAIPIYHRDIKSSNILLDENYQAKVVDFGTSKSIPIDQTHLTTKVRGTFGYFDPEYYQTSQLTDKNDVYRFGVVLVELLTGEKPISLLPLGECRNLASYFISMDENHLFDILDKEVSEHGEEEEIMAVSKSAKGCLGLQGRHRPTMKEVAMQLEQVRSLRNPLVVRQYEEEINRIRIGSICASSAIPLSIRLETQVELTSMEEDQSLLSPTSQSL